jgi:hypothetical protein
LLLDSNKPEIVDENTFPDKGKRWFHNIIRYNRPFLNSGAENTENK